MMCLSSSLLKQEGKEKQIISVNAQKHKAFQWQLPRTAWYSWQFERSLLRAVLYSSKQRQKMHLGRCTRAPLPKLSTVFGLFIKFIAADPAHGAYNLLITSAICFRSVIRTGDTKTLPPNQAVSLKGSNTTCDLPSWHIHFLSLVPSNL